MNVVDKETVNTSKQSSNDCMKTSVCENEHNKLEYRQPQLENPDNSKIKMRLKSTK